MILGADVQSVMTLRGTAYLASGEQFDITILLQKEILRMLENWIL